MSIKILKWFALLPAVNAGAALMTCGCAITQEKTVVMHGTATPGGGFPVYGEAFAATIKGE